MFNRKDHYYRMAKKEGKASRAAYKIEEIQKRYKIIQKGDSVLELGAAPGGWMQAIQQWVGPKGSVIGVDLLPLKIKPAPNSQFFQVDFNQVDFGKKQFQVIISDLSPDLTGIPFRDTSQSFEMAQTLFSFCPKWLASGGNLIFKIFPSEEFHRWVKEIKNHFEQIKIFVPEASRKESSEVYCIAKGWKKR